jgi:hypothetical protein
MQKVLDTLVIASAYDSKCQGFMFLGYAEDCFLLCFVEVLSTGGNVFLITFLQVKT